ncbi:MAG: nucleotidyl transferase AbiEii/AbiGii toxin family protein, partial [Oleiphilaceae bacterium]|nr:nucleotidyl transferase AbiEii/AbiGii toxin family protein [Oleiphilaceae bacterium]
DTRSFLLSLHDGSPDFRAINREWAKELPAVRWKLINLKKLKTENADKHAWQRAELENVWR